MNNNDDILDDVFELRRFEQELEFIQCLASPWYLNFLAQSKYLSCPVFLNYLKYLEYWRRPEYAQFLTYPICLYHLTLLNDEQFRIDISREDLARRMNDEIYYQWLDGQLSTNEVDIKMNDSGVIGGV
ncbi:hypothetical protein PNEG_01249 [Pneumocystis murina B123]|uniref:Mediator of RNA polymerase II transcription subunit 31 n=1 Tax=Pneumocystis murina (strain B123) TaxID=1069680 RepID=M7NTV1_PNEMU|nr:hypothetical protein PNEG_01249 [Pneumocystis murina B123]EMR10541.1 hypothetical protein PNEG_01249 [Pneumocystis murina B123]